MKKKKWFDNECHQLRQKRRTLSNKIHKNPYDLEIRNEHRSTLKKYKNLCRKKKFAHQNKEIENLNEATINPSLFWDIWENIGEEKEKNLNTNMSMVINRKVSLKTYTARQINTLKE